MCPFILYKNTEMNTFEKLKTTKQNPIYTAKNRAEFLSLRETDLSAIIDSMYKIADSR